MEGHVLERLWLHFHSILLGEQAQMRQRQVAATSHMWVSLHKGKWLQSTEADMKTRQWLLPSQEVWDISKKLLNI